MALYDACIRERLLNFLNAASLTSMVTHSARSGNESTQRQATNDFEPLPHGHLCANVPAERLHRSKDDLMARSVRAFVDVGDIMGHRALVRCLLTGDPPKPVLFQPTPNVPAVYAVLVREDEAFDPETQTVRRRIYIKYGRSRNVPARVQQHRVTYGMAVFLFMLPVPADMLVQCEGFLRDELSVDKQ